MTDMTDDDDAHASEALREARSQAAAKALPKKWVAGAVATGIGSAALVAALMYANRGRKKGDQ